MTRESRHVLVTGSTRGIGASIVEALVAKGARVIGHGRANAEGVIGADLATPGAADALWDQALARLDGRIDVLVNNAGVFEAVAVDAEAEEWQAAWARTLQINLQASADLSRKAILHWRERNGGGRIVNIASRAAYRGDSPAHWHYAASKAGMIGMTKSLAREVGPRGITANCIAPGFISTPMTAALNEKQTDEIAKMIPQQRFGAPEEIAAGVVYLASNEAAYITGQTLHINGGMAMV
jgi:NAD(P)-dependent dehydrogenase (short-subunit alcohol dehydrogenase family)